MQERRHPNCLDSTRLCFISEFEMSVHAKDLFFFSLLISHRYSHMLIHVPVSLPVAVSKVIKRGAMSLSSCPLSPALSFFFT